MVLTARRVISKGPHCKECGTATFRHQSHTFLLGWWGSRPSVRVFTADYKDTYSWPTLRVCKMVDGMRPRCCSNRSTENERRASHDPPAVRIVGTYAHLAYQTSHRCKGIRLFPRLG